MISYRRNDSAGWTAWLHDRLAAYFGDDEVFLDVDSIPVGEDFLQTITSIVTKSDALLAVIGKRWLTAKDANGQRRLNREDDTLRKEVETAIEYDIPILPVLVDKAVMPLADELPDSIRALAFKHAHDVDPKHFRRDVDALIGHIESAIRLASEKKEPVSLEAQVEELRKKLADAENALKEEQEEAKRARMAAADSGERIHYRASMKAFNAFLAYSHAADSQFAAALQTGLARFAKPWYRSRALRIFRDATNLSATPDLWSSITDVMDNSEYMILVASPHAAQSKWIEAELQYWLKTHSVESILIVLTDGDVVWDDALNDFDWPRTDAIPIALRGHFTGEPLYVDLRWAKDRQSLTLDDPQFSSAIAQLAAVIHGQPLDALVGEDVKTHRLTKRVVTAVTVALMMLLIYAIVVTALVFR
jgi:hypothetical protein